MYSLLPPAAPRGGDHAVMPTPRGRREHMCVRCVLAACILACVLACLRANACVLACLLICLRALACVRCIRACSLACLCACVLPCICFWLCVQCTWPAFEFLASLCSFVCASLPAHLCVRTCMNASWHACVRLSACVRVRDSLLSVPCVSLCCVLVHVLVSLFCGCLEVGENTEVCGFAVSDDTERPSMDRDGQDSESIITLWPGGVGNMQEFSDSKLDGCLYLQEPVLRSWDSKFGHSTCPLHK
jgi:hypothetical protein